MAKRTLVAFGFYEDCAAEPELYFQMGIGWHRLFCSTAFSTAVKEMNRWHKSHDYQFDPCTPWGQTGLLQEEQRHVEQSSIKYLSVDGLTRWITYTAPVFQTRNNLFMPFPPYHEKEESKVLNLWVRVGERERESKQNIVACAGFTQLTELWAEWAVKPPAALSTNRWKIRI